MWLDTLWSAERERVLKAMREARAESDRLLQQSRDLSPRNGEIAVGGEHFSAFVKGDAIANLLGQIGRGGSPQEAAFHAKAEARYAIAKFNDQRGGDYQVHRDPGHADTTIDRWTDRILWEVVKVNRKCKLHDNSHFYHRCLVCDCEYCDRYWQSCPRCFERNHGVAAARNNLVEPVGDAEGWSRRGIANK